MRRRRACARWPARTRGCARTSGPRSAPRSEEHTSELQSHLNLVCRLLLEKKKKNKEKHSQVYNEKRILRQHKQRRAYVIEYAPRDGRRQHVKRQLASRDRCETQQSRRSMH